MKNIKISARLKIYLKTLGLLLFLVFLVLIVSKFGVSQISPQRNKLSTQLKKEQALRAKSELLRTLEAGTAEQADLISLALPSANVSFIIVSQLNKLAQENSVFLTNLRIGSETKEANISSADLSFDAEGALASVLTFLQRMSGVAPMILIDKVQINQAQDTARATVRIKDFWAPFPTTLPALSEPLADLTNEEKEILGRIVNLLPPDFLFLTPQEPRENTTPF